ncbi:MAG: stage III sporulation protein AD [Clostridium sp.]|uniref:stage III sporulation protein AD n=1 Tax=Clostridium culturomicium TaxID=1499683 RepID=UPI00058FBA26|nr:stage III sporulation protein AD [Clostridium culturomicium]MDU4892454.1 stage III sporulation protein AD [Clostridium sp.]MDU7084465.1 stage III sporulation protein AD [Clostridium sp.]
MDIVKIVSFALVALLVVTLVKNDRKDIALLISLVAGIIIFIFMLSKLTVIVNFLQSLSNKANIDIVYLDTVFKILGIAYLTSFCSEICKDAGESSIASKVEFSGKILILTLAIPILMAVMQTILKIM